METNLGQIVLVKDINPNVFDGYYGSSYPESSSPYNFTEFNDQLYFTATDGQSGSELFVSDGTEEGTQLVEDLVLGSNYYGYPYSSRPSNLLEFNDRLYFTANDGQSGNELWATDGTSSGTQLVADINQGNYDSRYSYFPRSSYPSSFIEFDDQLYFIANDGENGRELFVSDGTAEGTQLLADIRPGSNNYGNLSSYPYGFTEFNDKLYFAANNGENGNELWVTDGTTEGTKLLIDLYPGTSNYGFSYGSYPRDFFEFNDQLYFTADNGESGRELFVSDGTAEGTQLLVDLRPGTSNYGFSYGSYPRNFIEFNDKLYFTANDGESGTELFVSDGTAEGTQLLVDLRPGTSNYGYNFSSYPENLIEFDDQLYFTANDGESGSELFVSDGTAEGTQLLADIRIGSGGSYSYSFPLSSYITDFTEFNGKLYFTAVGGEIGRELWVTDGTTAGTQLVEDLRPGNNNYGSGSYPYNLTVVGDELLFSANNGETGTELFKLTADDLKEPTPISVSDTDAPDDLLGSDNSEQIEDLNGQASIDIDGGDGNDTLLDGNGDEPIALSTGDGADTIVDLNLEGDRLGLSDDIQFGDSSFADNTIPVGDELLTTVNGIDTGQLTSGDLTAI